MSRYGEAKQCRALIARPSPLWGGGGGGGGAIDAPALRPALPPSPPLPQPAAGLPASGKFRSDQTPAGRGLVGGGSTPSSRCVQRTDPHMALVMFVMVTMIMIVMMVVIVAVSMIMIMMMIVPVLVMMNPLVRAAAARIFAEQQRLDRHRHGVGRHADAAEIDVVEIAQ